MEPFQLISFDPGGATGVAICLFDGQEFHIDATTIWRPEHHQGIQDEILEAVIVSGDLGALTVITEGFEFRQGTQQRRGLELISREYIGVMKLTCNQNGVPLIQQKPAHALSFMDDEKLKRCGELRTPLHENRHANDALRHLLFYLINTQKSSYWRDKLKS